MFRPSEGRDVESIIMRVEGCEFPDDLRYDAEAFTWARVEASGEVTVGITSLHAALAGKLEKVTAKPLGQAYDRGKVIGTVEGPRYFGPIRTAVSGVLVAVNEAVLHRPKALSEEPYAGGWFARLRPTHIEEDLRGTSTTEQARDLFAKQIAALRVRCFTAHPDYEMWEIGTECAAVLVRLTELVARLEVGEVVHIVSDDWTAPMEMDRWSQQSGQPIIETRREGNLYHFLVRKVS